MSEENWIKRLWGKLLGMSDEGSRSEQSEHDLRSSLNRSEVKEWKLKSFIGAFVALSAGFIGSTVLSEGWGSFEWHHLIRDASITLMITAVLIIVYEVSVKKSFIKASKKGLKEVYEEQQQFDEAGLKAIHPEGLNRRLLLKKILEKKIGRNPRDITILQTWLGFENQDKEVLTMIENAVRGGCKTRILLLDPLSDQVGYRASAIGEDEATVRVKIKNDLEELENLKNGLEKLDKLKEKYDLEYKVYDANPTIHIYEIDGTKLVTPKWRRINTIYAPQLEIVDPESHLGKRVEIEFNDLWHNNEPIVRDGLEALEEYRKWENTGLTVKDYKLCKDLGLPPEELREWKSTNLSLREFLLKEFLQNPASSNNNYKGWRTHQGFI